MQPRADERRFQHLRVAVGEHAEFDSALEQGFECGNHIGERREPLVLVQQFPDLRR